MKPGKSCSSLKKRCIRITRNGKVMGTDGYKRHLMMHRTTKKIRQTGGTRVRSKMESGILKKIKGL